MGQRLVVNINSQGRTICNMYFHWSAYTYDALLETKKIINCIYNHKDESEKELLLRLIHFCEENGGGISNGCVGGEWNYIQSLYPNETFKTEGISRNDGLIALSEKGIAHIQSWSEGDVYINLDEDMVDFCVYGGYDDLDEYIEERKSWDDEFEGVTLNDIPYIDCSLGYFDVKDIDNIIREFNNIDDDEFVVRCKNEIVALIA